ncbi:hypothetical protein B0H14DRAFT_2599683 [Mycena olivaceomarginata]|nr:hypothetical protein B0H14DRAFT_2599683 [Mycena olivaceomarginata]
MSYMVAGIILTGLSTTGETICENLKNILLLYTAVRFSMIVSDTTGNVKKCRELICKAFPWILNCPDPCHQLNLLAKDIMVGSKKFPKIKGNYGKKHLKDKLKDQPDRRGLVSFGATRFSTFADQSSSVERCLSAMEQCYADKTIKFDTKRRSLCEIISSAIRLNNENFVVSYTTSTCSSNPFPVVSNVESSQVTCSDVFNIWIGIAIGFKEVFCISVRSEARERLIAAFEARFRNSRFWTVDAAVAAPPEESDARGL